MKRLLILRLLALFLIATVPVASSFVALPGPAAVVADDDDDQGEDENDSGGEDQQNRGNNGNNGNTGRGNANNGKSIEALAGYSIDMTCEFDADADQTTCDLAAFAPDDGKKVGFVQIPEVGLCADVIETDAKFVDPDPHTGLAGYKSRGNATGFTLVFEGAVMTSGSAEYWIKAANNVFPVNGPGLSCSVPENETSEDASAPASTPTEVPSSGTLLVKTYACAGVPDDTVDYDWFGECQAADSPQTYSLTPNGVDTPLVSAETDANGEATFAEVAPGNWELELEGASWCHANSDKVTEEGSLVLEAGETTTVWIFVCDDTTDV